MEAQAFAEVYDIINHFEPQMYQKIPKELINTLKSKKDDDYEINIDYSRNINEQGILKETKAILAVIYRDYICNDNLRNKLKEYDFRILEKAKQEKYNSNEIFKEKEKQIKTEKNDANMIYVNMVKYKESIFTQILNFIKKLFKI